MIQKRKEQNTVQVTYWARQKDGSVYVVNCHATQVATHHNSDQDTQGRWLATFNTYPMVPPTHSDGTIIRVNHTCSHDEPAIGSEFKWMRYSFQDADSFKLWLTTHIEQIEKYCILWDSQDYYN